MLALVISVSHCSCVQIIDRPRNVVGPVRTAARSAEIFTIVPNVASPGKFETFTVTGLPPGTVLRSGTPITPSPHPVTSAAAAVASADLVRNSRRFKQSLHDMHGSDQQVRSSGCASDAWRYAIFAVAAFHSAASWSWR